jgi:hypothetical protein
VPKELVISERQIAESLAEPVSAGLEASATAARSVGGQVGDQLTGQDAFDEGHVELPTRRRLPLPRPVDGTRRLRRVLSTGFAR